MSDFKMIQAVVSSDSFLWTETVVWMDIKTDVLRRLFYMKRMTANGAQMTFISMAKF